MRIWQFGDQHRQMYGANPWIHDRAHVPKPLRWAILPGMHLFWSMRIWVKRDFAYSADINRDEQRLKTTGAQEAFESFSLPCSYAHMHIRTQTRTQTCRYMLFFPPICRLFFAPHSEALLGNDKKPTVFLPNNDYSTYITWCNILVNDLNVPCIIPKLFSLYNSFITVLPSKEWCEFRHNSSSVKEERGEVQGSGSWRTQSHTPWINGRQDRNGGGVHLLP